METNILTSLEEAQTSPVSSMVAENTAPSTNIISFKSELTNGKEFNNISNLKRHLETSITCAASRGEELLFYKCESCNKDFPGKSNLNKHIKSNKECSKSKGIEIKSFDCESCGKQFPGKDNLKNHLKQSHSCAKLRDLEIKTYDCSKCSNKLRHVLALLPI